MLLSALLTWLLTAAALLLVAAVLPGIVIDGFGVALIAALVMGLVNLLVRPLLLLLTLPLNLLTLGLFSFIINAMMFGLVAWLVPGFEVTNFLSALLGALLLALITTVVNRLTDHRTYA